MKVTADTSSYKPFSVALETDNEAKKFVKILDLAIYHIGEGDPSLPNNASQLNTFATEIKSAIQIATGVA